jgi:hypothetical protein
LNQEFELLKNDLIKAYDAKRMRASGKTADSLEVETGNDSVKLLGSSVFDQLEYGRGQTKSGGSKGSGKLIDAIKQWISDKGIVSNIKNDNNNKALAFLIARKIHRQGWNRQGYGGVNLVSEVITTQRIQSIINKVGNSLTITLVNRLEKELIAIK